MRFADPQGTHGRKISWRRERHPRQRRRRRSHEPRVRRRDRLSDHPSTEISEIYEAFRANGGINVWGKHPFFFEPEGEHSAQSGALGAALTGGKYVSNASSSQGILYGMELHYVTVGKKVGGFVLHVAARVVSKHSLNVMAGHDDIYALLPLRLHGSLRQQSAGGGRPRGDRLSAQRADADPGRQHHGRLRHEPHALRSADARARTAARVPRRPGEPHRLPDGGAGDAVRREGPRLPAPPVSRQGSATASRPRDHAQAPAISSQPTRRPSRPKATAP